MSNQSKFDQIHDVTAGGQQTNLIKRFGTVLQPYMQAAVEAAAPFIVRTLLDTPIDRQGLGKGIGNGKTTLRSIFGWYDDHVARDFANVDEVKQNLASITLTALPKPSTVEQVSEVKK